VRPRAICCARRISAGVKSSARSGVSLGTGRWRAERASGIIPFPHYSSPIKITAQGQTCALDRSQAEGGGVAVFVLPVSRVRVLKYRPGEYRKSIAGTGHALAALPLERHRLDWVNLLPAVCGTGFGRVAIALSHSAIPPFQPSPG
jgi:hypothetical protein